MDIYIFNRQFSKIWVQISTVNQVIVRCLYIRDIYAIFVCDIHSGHRNRIISQLGIRLNILDIIYC